MSAPRGDPAEPRREHPARRPEVAIRPARTNTENALEDDLEDGFSRRKSALRGRFGSAVLRNLPRRSSLLAITTFDEVRPCLDRDALDGVVVDHGDRGM
jgi:hypothetical protein